jgi:hypothetical protein
MRKPKLFNCNNAPPCNIYVNVHGSIVGAMLSVSKRTTEKPERLLFQFFASEYYAERCVFITMK